MAGAMTAIAIAAGGASLLCIALVARLQRRRRAVSRSSWNGYGADTGGGDDSADGTSHSHSSYGEPSASAHSGGPSDAGDGGGGGDGGGDGGGGGSD